MPLYEYSCPITNDTYEVIHNRNEILNTWSELCEKLNIPIGEVPPDTPIKKLFNSKLAVVGKQKVGDACAPQLPPSMCCGGGCK